MPQNEKIQAEFVKEFQLCAELPKTTIAQSQPVKEPPKQLNFFEEKLLKREIVQIIN